MDSRAMVQDALNVLKSVFGYFSFRPLQAEIIQAISSKQDTVVLMPTGGGKSLCYQVPALMLPGTAVVVSPLISLMQDQVTVLKSLGVKADFLNSSLTGSEKQRVLSELQSGQLKLLYVAPERLMSEGFFELLSAIELSLFAIDEAHCISEWGHDFRPDYRILHRVREMFPQIPLIALTATATDRVLADIQKQLKLENAQLFKGSFNRENLFYEIRQKKGATQHIIRYVQGRVGESGIIYCQSRKQVDTLTEKLNAVGVKAAAYHAGLSDGKRRDNQQSFIHDQVDVVVATIAFGMGIDKPDVRYVIHYDLPKTLENYYQETGRAGRDSQPSDCVLYYSYGDKHKYARFIDEISDPKERQRATIKLNQMVQFAFRPLCRRKQLLQYFSENYPKDNCETCDVCVNPPEMMDITVVSQKILSCVYRVGQRFGVQLVVDVLRGDQSDLIYRYGFERLSVYGIEQEISKNQLKDIVQYLVYLDHLMVAGLDYPILKLTEKARGVLRGEVTVEMPVYKKVKPKKEKKEIVIDAGPVDLDLFEKLRLYRLDLARERGVPPYVIFHDKTLKELAARQPDSEKALLSISGIGQKKAEDIGVLFLEKIREHVVG